MKIELQKLSDVKPYPNNPRLNDDAVEAVAASIREFGFRQPIVVDPNGVIVCGHARWKAAQKLGLEKVPVHVAKDLTPEQIKAYRIADNQTASLGEWNYDLLPIEIGELRAVNYDLGLLGFDSDALAELLNPGVRDGLCDPDEVPDPPDEATTKPGDLWVLGDHRLLCGDSSKPADVDRLLDGATIHLVNTDPPLQREGRTPQQQRHRRRPIQLPGTDASPGLGRCPPSQQVQSHAPQDAGEEPAADQRLRDRRGIRSASASMVRQPGPRPRARSRLLHLGRLRQLRQLPARAEGLRSVLLAGRDLGEGASASTAGGKAPPMCTSAPTTRWTCGRLRRSTRSRWSTLPKSPSSWPCGR